MLERELEGVEEESKVTTSPFGVSCLSLEDKTGQGDNICVNVDVSTGSHEEQDVWGADYILGCGENRG